jgi:hypothetical protein
VAGRVWTRMRSGPWATSSAAKDRRLSFPRPSVVRGSRNTMFRPSLHPSLSRAGRSRPRKASMSARGNPERKPMRRVVVGLWARRLEDSPISAVVAANVRRSIPELPRRQVNVQPSYAYGGN